MPTSEYAAARKLKLLCVYCPQSTSHGQRRCQDCKKKERLRERMIKSGTDRMTAYGPGQAWRVGVTR